MRLLILLRGMPGIGKSSFLSKWELEGHTLSADTVRTLFACPVRTPSDGTWDIDQRYNGKVFSFLKERMIERMRRGETLIMDEQNINISEYKAIADRFFYEVIVVQFPMDKERALEQNSKRHPEYKRVPNYVIERSYERMKETDIPKGVKVMSPQAFEREYLEIPYDPVDQCFANGDMSQFFPDGCAIFGDLHGCMQPVQDYFASNAFSDNKLYVFLGDYLDRGPQNGDLLKFLIQLANKPNCIFLEGNHFWERYYAKGQMEDVLSDEFIQYTIPQIADIPKEQISDFCSKWKPYFCFRYGNEAYFCSHAGFGYIPDDIFKMSMHDFVKGSKYSDDVDAWYNSSWEAWMPIQVHGHRNQYKYAMDKFPCSINMCSPVEFGGPLRVLEISRDSHKFIEVPNTLGDKLRVNMRESALTRPAEKTQSEKTLIELRKHSKDIREKVLPGGISSFNFSRDVFQSGIWSELSKYARGLFLDSTSGVVVTRSWPKFFNWGELHYNEEFLKATLKFPVNVYQKYNGFLGLLTWHNGELLFASKSTTEGPFAERFKELFYALLSEDQIRGIQDFLFTHDVTFLFEVIDPDQDPHIIEYDKPNLVLLDVIGNLHEEQTLSYELLEKVAKTFKLSYKLLHATFYNWYDVQQMYMRLQSDKSEVDLEGFVIEDSNHFRVKIKTKFYTFWKHLRSIKNRIARGKPVALQGLTDDAKQVVTFMETNYRPEKLETMSIIEVRHDYDKYMKGEQDNVE